MSVSFPIKAKIGEKVIAEDVLFTSSHPTSSTFNSGWTKTPAYAPVSAVPLKAGLVDQFRKAAAASSEVETLAHVDRLMGEKTRLINEMKKISVVKEEQLLAETFTPKSTRD